MASDPIDPAGPTPHAQVAPNLLSIQQKYAWEWFTYHASQRMTALNFFFVTVSIFAVAYSKCVEYGWRGFGVVTGVSGFFTAIAFWFIDVRNEELVNCGRAALGEVEKQLNLEIRDWDHDRAHLEQSTRLLSRLVLRVLTALSPRRGPDVFAHRFWIRSMQGVAAAAFLFAAVLAVQGFPSAGAILNCLRHWIHC